LAAHPPFGLVPRGARALAPSCSFFLHHSVAPRPLHSFPTRRSSDLYGSRRCRTQGSGTTRNHCVDGAGSISAVYSCNRTGAVNRSEEHTSELQSRFDLVCRLLLEKKKNAATAP